MEGRSKALGELGRDNEGLDARSLGLVPSETDDLRDELGEVGLVDGNGVCGEELAQEREGLGGEESGVGGSGGGEGVGDSGTDDDGLGVESSSENSDEFSKEEEASLLGGEGLGSELLEDLLEEAGDLRLKEGDGTVSKVEKKVSKRSRSPERSVGTQETHVSSASSMIASRFPPFLASSSSASLFLLSVPGVILP